MKYIILTLVFLTTNLFATSASNRIWYGASSINSVSEKIDFQILGEVRYNSTLGETAQSVFLFGPHYKLNETHKMAFLYGLFHSTGVEEHRFTLQHQQKYGNLLNFSVTARTRIAGRYLEDNSNDSTRFRYAIIFLENSERKYNTFFWNELFINLTDEAWTGNRTIERNRAFLGMRIHLNQTKFDIGYMNEFIPRDSGDRVEHILSLTYHM